MVIDDLVTLFPNVNVDIIAIYIRKATVFIVNHMNNDSIIDATGYDDAVTEFVTLCINKRGNEGLQAFGQGSRSGTYATDSFESVKALLPPPYVKMMGVPTCGDNYVK